MRDSEIKLHGVCLPSAKSICNCIPCVKLGVFACAFSCVFVVEAAAPNGWVLTKATGDVVEGPFDDVALGGFVSCEVGCASCSGEAEKWCCDDKSCHLNMWLYLFMLELGALNLSPRENISNEQLPEQRACGE
jgi:hypothetical protein